MEYDWRNCKACTDSGPNQEVKLPRHKIKSQNVDQRDEELCDKCLFDIERSVYSIKELVEM